MSTTTTPVPTTPPPTTPEPAFPIVDAQAARVYTRQNWADDWTLRPSLRAVQAVQAAAPEISSATIRQYYGNRALEGESAFTTEAPVNYRDQYVKIACGDVVWIGVIVQSGFDLLGSQAADPTGVQDMIAYGLEHLLDRIPIDRALCDTTRDFAGAFPTSTTTTLAPTTPGPTSSTTSTTEPPSTTPPPLLHGQYIAYCPTFNRKHQKGYGLLGNRSKDLVDGEYMFSRDGALWSFFDILNYLLDRLPAGGPVWRFDDTNVTSNDLAQLYDVVDLDGLTVFKALNRLIDRRRGYGWCVRVTGDGRYATIWIFSILSTDITSGDRTFHANTEQFDLAVNAEVDVERAFVRLDRSVLYDQVRVRGARVKSCFTVSFADGTLEEGWTGEEELAYKEAALSITGYSDLTLSDKAHVNDAMRAEDALNRVYSVYRIPPGWNWLVGPGHDTHANPLVNTDGSLTYSVSNAWNFDRPLLPHLPLEEGRDYSQDGAPALMTQNVEPVFRAPFAILKNLRGQWRYVDKLDDQHLPAGHVKPKDREMALEIAFRPAHLLALANWPDAEPSEWVPAYDYHNLLLTVAVETDQCAQVIAVSDGYPNAEFPRKLTIEVPEAELWYCADGTVVGISDEGELLELFKASPDVESPVILRDDTDLLRSVAALALAWYGRERSAIRLSTKRIVAYSPPGAMVHRVIAGTSQVFTVNSVVTRQSWQFGEQKMSAGTGVQTTTLETEWWDVDLAKLASDPAHPSAARAMTRVESGQRELARWLAS